MDARTRCTKQTAMARNEESTNETRPSSADTEGETTVSGLSIIGSDQPAASRISLRRLRRSSSQHKMAFEQSDRGGDIKTPPPSVEDGDRKLPAKTHNTRLKNGIYKQKMQSVVSTEDPLEQDPEKELLVDKCAHLLATVDSRGYQRALLRDANAILENLILPMSCPWTHANEPVVRTIPRDVDDLCRTFELEPSDGDVAELGSHPLCPTALRSSDPGVIQLTSFYPKPPPPGRKSSRVRKSSRSRLKNTSEDIPGELSLMMYEETQKRKRHRGEPPDVEKVSALVSIRFAGTSSRAEIFDNVPKGRNALLLDALLPREVVDGRHVIVSNAPKISGPLGSYDCRYGLLPADEKAVKDGQRAPRTHAGRTRLYWTTRESSNVDSPSKQIRPGYRSLISGKMMKNGSHKRPRSVKVGIRIHGELLCVKKSSFDSFIKRSSPNTAEASILPYPSRLLEEALEHACDSSGR